MKKRFFSAEGCFLWIPATTTCRRRSSQAYGTKLKLLAKESSSFDDGSVFCMLCQLFLEQDFIIEPQHIDCIILSVHHSTIVYLLENNVPWMPNKYSPQWAKDVFQCYQQRDINCRRCAAALLSPAILASSGFPKDLMREMIVKPLWAERRRKSKWNFTFSSENVEVVLQARDSVAEKP